MRSWTYVEPGEEGVHMVFTVTDEWILKNYFPYWTEQMIRVGKEDMISEERCIEDWVTVNWASEEECK